MSPEEYLAQSRSEQATATKQVAFSLTQDKSTDPDQHAADIKLAQSLSLPTSLTSQFRDTFAQRMEQKRNETILSANPVLSNWMQTPDNAKVARDDLPALSWWEQFSKGALSGGAIETTKAVPRGVVAGTGMLLEGSGQLLSAEKGADQSPVAKRIAEARSRSPEEIAQLRKDIFQQGVINPSIAQSVLSDVLSGDMRPDEAYSAFEPALEDISRGLQAAGEKTQDFSQTIMPASEGWKDGWASAIGEGLGSMVPILIAGLATGGAGAAAVGAVQGAGQGASDAREGGADEDTQTISAFMNLLPGATDAIPIERILNNHVVKRGLASVLRRIGTQAVVEGGQEGVQQVMQNAIAQYLYAPDRKLTEGLGDNAGVGGAIGAIMEAGKIAFELALPGRVRRMHLQAGRAEQTRQTIDQIGEAANTSKLRQRLDGSFMDFVGKATEGTPIQDIYVPAEKMQELFQSYRFEPHDFLTDLPGFDPSEWDTAVATGGDIKIPTGTYAAKLAGTDFDTFLRENMRFDPDGMTFSEAQEFNSRADEIRMQAFQESEAARVAADAERSVDQQEYDELVGRLRAAGRSTDVARFEAMPIVAMRRTMAGRAGLSAEDFALRNPLPEFRGEVPEGLKTKDVDELTRQLAEMRAFKASPVDNGPSLLEAISDYGGINDTGGELKARNASIIKRGKGKKNLRLARGGIISGMQDLLGPAEGGKKHGLDDVAQAMIDAGYLQDNATANEYRHAIETGGEVPDIGKALLEAIDEELRGNVQYSGNVAADEKSSLVEANIAYLDSLGVSINDSDDVIREALRKAQDEEGRKYGQGRLLFQDGKRGSIQLPFGGASNSPVIISLFESADLSTTIHESSHYFLNTLQDLQTLSPDIQEMYSGVKDWWRGNADAVAADAKAVTGVEVTADDVRAALDEGTSGDAAVDAAIDTGMHEQFARGFEAYVMEGKAPSIELRSAFERFTQWLIRLYKSLRNLNVNISPEMKTVYDRLLATDAEIEAARSDVSDEMLFAAAEAAGVSPEDYRQLVKLHEQSVDAANQKLRREVMAPIQRETEKWYREEKARVREEVTGQVNARPEYRAWEWLGNRRWLGEEQPKGMPDMRLDRKALVDRYGEGVLKTLPRGKFTIYANEGGMDPDEVAGWFGFESGEALVKGLERAQPRREAIEAETDRLMRERHGDVLRDGQVEEKAIEAVHNDKRGQFLAAELKILKARAGDISPDMTVAQAREAARQTLNGMQVRDAIAANRFLTAERKAANEAVKLARLVERENLWSRQQRRDVQSAVKAGSLRAANSATDRANASTDRFNDAVSLLVEQKRRQLLNHMLYSESQSITEEVERAERFVARLGKPSTRKNLAGDYLDAVDELLERYDFRKLSIKAEQRRGSLLAYVQRMTDEGRENELSIPDDVMQDAKRKPYKQLSVDQLRGVIDTLKNIEHTARLKQRLLDAKRERDLDAVVGDIITEFDENVSGSAPSRARSGRGGARENVRSYLNLVKNADTILREIDGFKDGGAAYRHIKAPIDEAVSELMVKRRQAGEDFEKLYDVYSKEERRTMAMLQSVPELNGQFSKWDLISLALNTGNEGNYQRLTDQRVKGYFTPQQIDVALGRLDERDWKFVQSAWNLIDGYWPEIEAREKRVTGVAPEKIEPREVKTNYGAFKGGYYPIKYDAEISSLARDDDLNDLAKSMTGGRFGKAQTKNGHTKERSSSSGRPVLIDIGVLHGHVNQVIHDLALSEVVANSWRILQNIEVKNAFLDRGLKSDFDSLEVWLQDVASGEVRSSDFMNRWARKLKSGFTVSKLALNVVTVLLQPSGLAQSVVVVGKKHFLLGVQDMFRRPLFGPNSAAAEIISKSPFMQERETTFNKDIYDILGDTKTGPTQNRVSQFTSDYLAPWGFWMMQKAQFYTVDMPTWLAGYRQAMDQGMSDKDAVAHADRIVARAAASGNFSDRTPIERGTLSRSVRQNDVVRLFTALGSYMFAKFNVAYEKTRQTTFTDPRQVLTWTTDMVMLFTVEAVLAAAVRGQLPWGDDDEDEDGWGEFLAKQTAMSIAGTLPFVRDIASGVQGFSGGGAYGSMMDTIARPIYQASQGDIDKAFVRSIVDAGGLFLHAPSTQINRFIDAAWRQSEGDDVSPIEFIMGKSK